jgi:hypothetical protein
MMTNETATATTPHGQELNGALVQKRSMATQVLFKRMLARVRIPETQEQALHTVLRVAERAIRRGGGLLPDAVVMLGGVRPALVDVSPSGQMHSWGLIARMLMAHAVRHQMEDAGASWAVTLSSRAGGYAVTDAGVGQDEVKQMIDTLRTGATPATGVMYTVQAETLDRHSPGMAAYGQVMLHTVGDPESPLFMEVAEDEGGVLMVEVPRPHWENDDYLGQLPFATHDYLEETTVCLTGPPPAVSMAYIAEAVNDLGAVGDLRIGSVERALSVVGHCIECTGRQRLREGVPVLPKKLARALLDKLGMDLEHLSGDDPGEPATSGGMKA